MGFFFKLLVSLKILSQISTIQDVNELQYVVQK